MVSFAAVVASAVLLPLQDVIANAMSESEIVANMILVILELYFLLNIFTPVWVSFAHRMGELCEPYFFFLVSVLDTQSAQAESPVILTTVLPISKILSTPRTSAIPSTGSPTA